MLRPTKEAGQQIRQAAAAAGQSVQAYILYRIAGDGDAPAPAPTIPQYITPEAMNTAIEAAKEAGEPVQEWIGRAIKDTANRDEQLRLIFKK